MSRNVTLLRVLLALSLLLAATTAQANSLLAEATTAITIESQGAHDTVAANGDRIVFRNLLASSTRIVFASKDEAAFACQPDGDEAIRSRSNQYLLRGGAELTCTVRPGMYRYTTLTSERGAIRRARAPLRVRR